jgi:hypothetical protein
MSDMVVMLAITDHGSEPRAKPWLPGKSCLWFIMPAYNQEQILRLPHHRTRLNSDLEVATVPVQNLGDSLGIGWSRAAPQAAALLIDDADRGLLL